MKILLAILFLCSSVLAQEVTFGGYTERFGADEDGDNTPPTCTLTVPEFAAAPFQVLWFCEDNKEPQDNLQSELWIRRNGATVDRPLEEFLGFPAGLDISNAALGISDTAEFSSGLPAGFRLVVRDRAGNATISPLVVVNPGVQPVQSCDVSLVVEGETDGDIVGTTTAVTLNNASVSATSAVISGSGTAVLCEVDEVCADDSVVEFSITYSGSATEATLSLESGAVTADLSGSVTIDGSTPTAAELSGTTTVGDSTATATVSCER